MLIYRKCSTIKTDALSVIDRSTQDVPEEIARPEASTDWLRLCKFFPLRSLHVLCYASLRKNPYSSSEI